MVIKSVKRVLGEYRELKKDYENNKISAQEFKKLCEEKYKSINIKLAA